MENENENVDEFFENLELSNRGEFIQKQLSEKNDLLKMELLNFTRSLIKKAEAKNSLKDRVVEILEERLNNEDEFRDIPTSVLANLFEKLAKTENDFVANILQASKNSTMAAININMPGAGGKAKEEGYVEQKPKELDISKTEYDSIKNVLNFINKVKEDSPNSHIEAEVYEKDKNN